MSSTAGLKDVDLYFSQIETIIKQYRRLVQKLEAIKGNKKKGEEVAELCSERVGLQTAFIDKKNACRANIKLLASAAAVLKERALADLQAQYREVDAEFKALGIMADRANLLDGAPAARGGFNPGRATNTELLDKALDTQQTTTAKLKEALTTVEATKETGRFTAAQLEEDREKLKRIDAGLDEVESELAISAKLITRFVKRLYTDKVIIAFTALLVLGIVGIVVYAALNPNQTLFNVPDVVTPPTSFTTPTPSPSAARRALADALLRGRA